ncbi:DoxX family membrane protein [uncultured Pontibacter sp.]|uniref:MauE/DoxX family redox-associated membrane protein n=1 Tax=uncultured Pontibacter sp. TaxID=453356 RepID=UPI0026087891|nr:DoxX family membrane protein [uncultured Pontibacter sp.]
MMEDRYLPYASLLMRFALAITLLSAIADRLGILGEPGQQNVLWGEWSDFVDYMHTLVPFISRSIADKLALAITFIEFCLAFMLLFGLKIRWAAIGTGILHVIFALAILNAFGLKAVLDHGLFVSIAASFLLASIPIYKWTLHGIKKRTVYNPY